MEPTLRDPRGFFDAYVAESLQQDLLRVVARSYPDALREIRDSEYPFEEAHDLFPNVRRARIDSYLRGLAPRFPGLTARAELNSARNSYHTFLRIGQVMLTASAAEAPTSIVRDAVFRNSLAGAQTGFAYDPIANAWRIPDEIPLSEGLLYALIIHGSQQGKPYALGFTHIVFPNQDCSAYLDSIDLRARYPQVITEFAGVEQVGDQAQPEIPVLSQPEREIERES